MSSRQYFAGYILAALCVLGLCAPAAAAPAGQASQASGQKVVAPVNGRVYAKQRADAYMTAFTGVYRCVVAKMSVYAKETKFSMSPDDLYLCAAPLQQFKETRILLDFGPPLVFESEKEEQAIRADAALVDSLHEHICGIFNQLVSIKRTKTQADLLAFQNIFRWADEEATKSLQHLRDLDTLVKRYADLKNKGRMVSSPFPHFEASSSVLKEMDDTVKKLGAYIAFNVESRHLCPAGKGLFLVDFDSHSTRFSKNVDGCIRRIDALAGRFKSNQKWLIAHNINDLRQLKAPNVFTKFEMLPEAMIDDICGRSIAVFELFSMVLKEMRDGKGDRSATKFLKQGVLQGTSFSPNAEFSYVKSVRDAVSPLMLNTVDKNNKPLKHTIRGQF